jgi:dihydroorotate dehydrogenase electron transfer subunit
MNSVRRSLASAPVLERWKVARDTWVIRYGIELQAPVVPGQFAMVHPGDDDRYVLPRPLSILDADDGGMDLLIKVVGRGSEELVGMPVGATARIFGPLGRGFDVAALREREVILVAGGVGLVPLHMLSRRLKALGTTCHPLFGARAPEDLPMGLLADAPAGPWELWVESDPGVGLNHGLVTAGLERALEGRPGALVATCGPTPMMQAVARICRDRSVDLQVCLEEQMGCGAGVCRACVIEADTGDRQRTVCSEGPVFDVREIRFLPEDCTGPAAQETCP